MDKLIARIIRIDQSAQAVASDAKDRAEGFDRELRQQIEELRRELSEEAEGQIAKIREAEEARGLARMKAQDGLYEAGRAALLEKKGRLINQWVDEVVALCCHTS